MTTVQNPLRQLASFGQSVWLDFIERSFLRDGRLTSLIEEDGVSGVTSNPAADGIRKFIQPHEATLSALRQRIVALKA